MALQKIEREIPDVHCGTCGALMELWEGSETPLQLRCSSETCHEYFYAASRGLMAIGTNPPVELDAAFRAVGL